MFKKTDPNSFSKSFKLMETISPTVESKETSPIQIGYLLVDYHVVAYDDVQTQNTGSVVKGKNRKFMIHCKQRIIINNPNTLTIKPDKATISYENYPALIYTFLNIESKDATLELLDYSPKTVNTQIQSSGTSGNSTGKTKGNSVSNTVGSSHSDTNSFGVSVTVGLFNDSATASYDHSSTSTHSKSRTQGTNSSESASKTASQSDSMSIKDWGAYAFVNPSVQNPSWVFGQEYPWNIIKYRKTQGKSNPNEKRKQVELIIPSEMQLRLYDRVSLSPPSQLSTFGLNFVMKALWLVTLPNYVSDVIELVHSINYYAASHSLDKDNNVHVYMDEEATELKDESRNDPKTEINLPLMALNVLGTSNASGIIGFIPNKFTVTPNLVSNGKARLFKIISTSNNLMIQDTTRYTKADNGAGFSVSDTGLSVGFAKTCTAVQMTMYFKITDTVDDYTLYLKHWKTQTHGVKLTFIINNVNKRPITKFVDSLEAEGGENNLLAITLRNQDYASVDYHDYLQLGLNSIQIIIEPVTINDLSSTGYTIRAVSIEKNN